MICVRQLFTKAASSRGLPFFVLTVFLSQFNVSLLANENTVLTFQVFGSSCIDLAHYDAKSLQLTVRFVNRNPEKFYRYGNVPAEVWKKLNVLNGTGGVGKYLNGTILQHPDKFPFEELTIPRVRLIPRKQKAGDSK